MRAKLCTEAFACAEFGSTVIWLRGLATSVTCTWTMRSFKCARAGEIASERGVIRSNARGAVTPRGAVLGDAGTVSLALSTHLPSPGGDPDQYKEEQSGKHIAGVYIFEAGPAGWTGIEDCLCPQ